MSIRPIANDALERALRLRDLTDPSRGPHAMQRALACVVAALERRWGVPVRETRASPVVRVEDNYDALHYPRGATARASRYTRYVTSTLVLRTHTSAMIPGALRALAQSGEPEALLVCPGLVYRRDCIDRLHTGEPHQVDLWRIRKGGVLGPDELSEMVAGVVSAALPGARWWTTPASHPYTEAGLQIDVESAGQRVEIGECGLALPALLVECGLPLGSTGLAMGLGLDRLLMLRKGIDDIRLLRSHDPRVAGQMLDLAPYRPVSTQPAAVRDLSVAVPRGMDAERLGDSVRQALGPRAARVESIEVLSESAYESLPEAAIARLGLAPTQKNLLVRVVLRDLDGSISREEANLLRDAIYDVLHEGAVRAYAGRQTD